MVSNLGSEHVNDEDSEGYILGQLPEPEIARLEKHLHACKECGDGPRRSAEAGVADHVWTIQELLA